MRRVVLTSDRAAADVEAGILKETCAAAWFERDWSRAFQGRQEPTGEFTLLPRRVGRGVRPLLRVTLTGDTRRSSMHVDVIVQWLELPWVVVALVASGVLIAWPAVPLGLRAGAVVLLGLIVAMFVGYSRSGLAALARIAGSHSSESGAL